MHREPLNLTPPLLRKERSFTATIGKTGLMLKPCATDIRPSPFRRGVGERLKRMKRYKIALIFACVLAATGCNSSAKRSEANQALLEGIRKGDTAKVRTLLEQGADREARNESERTPLMLASLKGQEAMVALLLERGADLKATDPEGMTPLLWAAFGGNAKVVKLLISKGADVHAKDHKGQGALEWARDHPDVIEAFKQADAK